MYVRATLREIQQAVFIYLYVCIHITCNNNKEMEAMNLRGSKWAWEEKGGEDREGGREMT